MAAAGGETRKRAREDDDAVQPDSKKARTGEMDAAAEGSNAEGGNFKKPVRKSVEMLLLARLSTKEAEIHELRALLQDLQARENPETITLKKAMIDPAVNVLFERMSAALKTSEANLKKAQEELQVAKFNPQSQTGRALMQKCRMLQDENEEMGRQLSESRVQQLENELAIQKKLVEELGASLTESQDFVIQLDEEVEGLQSTIYALRQELRTLQSKDGGAAAEGAGRDESREHGGEGAPGEREREGEDNRDAWGGQGGGGDWQPPDPDEPRPFNERGDQDEDVYPNDEVDPLDGDDRMNDDHRGHGGGDEDDDRRGDGGGGGDGGEGGDDQMEEDRGEERGTPEYTIDVQGDVKGDEPEEGEYAGGDAQGTP